MMTAVDLEQFIAAEATSRWIKEVLRFLPVKSQFILSGNIRDRYPFPVGSDRYVPKTLTQYLSESLKLAGCDHFIAFNTIHGFSVITPTGEDEAVLRGFFTEAFGLKFGAEGRSPMSLERAMEVIERLVSWERHHIAVFADFASRYVVRPDSLDSHEHDCFMKALLLSHGTRMHVTERQSSAMFNPLFWICDKENDLPGWLALDNPRVRPVIVPRPDHVLRRALLDSLAPSVPGFEHTSPEERAKHFTGFVEQTEGMKLVDVIAITELCRREKLVFTEIEEAVRRYKLGVTEDPWKRLDRAKIAGAEEQIRERVKGQEPAVKKSLDIIKRAMTGLSGAQGTKTGGRPRGVMFLAGPTGTGKTELAKTLTELLFGDESAYIRFDMSEFSAEHADQRLLGAPPGYVGYDSGGELTNAIKEKPFAVVLFDEIEKAHPRILDKFLQLLDDGVLTSGRGERVYFSEAVIIFTSNLGIYRTSADGMRELNVEPGEAFIDVERKVRAEIERYFKQQLNRPELLNRIGENIVVFDFIRPQVAGEIYEKMARGVLRRLAERRKIHVSLLTEVDSEMRERCTQDLSNGGRGIGNQLEAWLINPLARALFDSGVSEGSRLEMVSTEEIDGAPTVRLRPEAATGR